MSAPGGLRKGFEMGRKRYTVEQIIRKLREAEVERTRLAGSQGALRDGRTLPDTRTATRRARPLSPPPGVA